MTNNQNDASGQSEYEPVGERVRIFARGGRWYANYQHEGRQVRRSLKTTSKKEARRRALLIEQDLLVGEHKRQPRSSLISEVVDQYVDHLQSEGRASKTVRKYQFCFKLLLDIVERRAQNESRRRVTSAASSQGGGHGSRTRNPLRGTCTPNRPLTSSLTLRIARGFVALLGP